MWAYIAKWAEFSKEPRNTDITNLVPYIKKKKKLKKQKQNEKPLQANKTQLRTEFSLRAPRI